MKHLLLLSCLFFLRRRCSFNISFFFIAHVYLQGDFGKFIPDIFKIFFNKLVYHSQSVRGSDFFFLIFFAVRESFPMMVMEEGTISILELLHTGQEISFCEFCKSRPGGL